MSYNEEEYDAFAAKMEERFPEMFSGQYGGFAIGAGWWPVVESLCSNIQNHVSWRNTTRERLLKDNPYKHVIPEAVEPVVVHQVKEKFGGLRFYYEGGDDVVSGMVRMAEAWAGRICEECGVPGKTRSGGWIRTLCDKHEEERQQRMKER